MFEDDIEIKIPKQTAVTLRNPCLQTDRLMDRRAKWFQYTPLTPFSTPVLESHCAPVCLSVRMYAARFPERNSYLLWSFNLAIFDEQDQFEGFDSCDQPSNLAQIWSKFMKS